jgi:hypothetical protein
MEAVLAFLHSLNRFSRALPILLLLALGSYCLQRFDQRSVALARLAGDSLATCGPASLVSPDSRTGGYGAASLDALFACWGPEGRRLYVQTQLSLDLVFPLVYSLLLGLLVLSVAQGGQERWALVPLLAAAADLGENALLAGLAWQGPPVLPALASLALVLTWAKFGLLAASLASILVLAVRRLISFLSTRSA